MIFPFYLQIYHKYSFDYFKPAFVEVYYVQQATFFIAPVTSRFW